MAPPYIIDDVLVDDSVRADLAIGLKGLQRLDEQFEYRLGRLIGAKVSIQEAQGASGLNVYISLPNDALAGYVAHTRTFAADLQSLVRRIANSQYSSTESRDADELWDTILLFAYQNIDEKIKMIDTLYRDQKTRFDSMACTMFNLDGANARGSRFDMEVGAHVVRLEQLARIYNGAINQQDELVELAWNMVRTHADLEVRMRALLQSIFAQNLYSLVCKLSHPKRTLHTIMRIAKHSEDICNVNIRLEKPPASQSSKPPLMKTKPSSPPRMGRKNPLMTSPSSLQHQSLSVMDVIKQYSSKEDIHQGIHRLQPVAKQNAAILVAFTVRGLVPPPSTQAYYSFGFASCAETDAEYALSSTYRKFLNRKQGKPANFQDLVHALEATKIPLLPDEDGHHKTLVMPRSVKDFLFTTPAERPSVWRLVQFLRDEANDEPPPCVKRDYGFQLCTQREHVTALRNLYAAVLLKTVPLQLHSACEHGGLLRFASKLIFVEPKMHRFLHNDDYNPGVGYDNNVGLGMYMLPLFKKSPKS